MSELHGDTGERPDPGAVRGPAPAPGAAPALPYSDRPAWFRPVVLAALLLLAINLRPAVNALGAVIPALRGDTGLTGASAGVLLALPTLSFALLGVGAPAVAARIGSHRTVLLAVLAMIAGQLLRAVVPGVPMLFIGSVLTLAGIAAGNVLLPGLVRLHFPDRITVVTACYTVLLTAGGSIAAALTIPLQTSLGGDWRLGIGLWSALAAVALIPWITTVVSVGRPLPRASQARAIPVTSLRRSRLAWAMAGYFGLQSMQAYVAFGWLPEIYVDAGLSDQAAAFQVSLLTAIGIPIAAIVPWLLGRIHTPRVLIVAMIGCYSLGYLGLILSPGSAPSLWSILLGLGGGSFPTALTLIALRTRTPQGTLALSAFAQSAGYLIASVGPVLFGIIHDWTGGWTWSLIAICGVLVVHLFCGLGVSRRRFLEDELTA
ncbi:MFS transporter [Nakamurella sp. A5-74]|uniref:MFS transporter n=1 Tax=Nakamurella sp. A5-74 TaxID=3158264 RepID=A0AAU8DSZ7_9ACTN